MTVVHPAAGTVGAVARAVVVLGLPRRRADGLLPREAGPEGGEQVRHGGCCLAERWASAGNGVRDPAGAVVRRRRQRWVGCQVRDSLIGRGPQAGPCSTGVLKKSARCDKVARELAGSSPSTAVACPRPPRASVTWAAGGPAVLTRVPVSVTAPRVSRTKTPPPSPPSVSFSCT